MSLEQSPAKTGRRLLTEGDICERLGISRVTLWRWVRAGTFDQPVYLGPATKRWTEDMYENYVERRVAERDAAPAA